MNPSSAPPAAPLRRRPEISPLALNALVALWLLATCNATFWARLSEIFGTRPFAFAVMSGAVFALMLLVVNLLAVRRLQRPVLAALVILAAVTSYYQDRLGVTLDRDMIQNVLTTTVNEGKHLLTPALLIHVALRAGPGLALVFWPRIRRGPRLRAALAWALACAGAAGLMLGLLLSDLRELSTTLRGRKDLTMAIQPLAPLSSTLRYARMMAKAQDIVTAPFGRDAVKGPLIRAATKPVLMVIVAGETSRAQNWSLGGYGRMTNPELAKRDIVYFPEVTACATATAKSMPCMFSHLTQAEYSYEGALAVENLLDVLSHAGFRVEWWDNNTGDKDIAKRLPVHMMGRDDDPAACARGECTDQVFLPRLEKLAATMTGDTVVVLHQIGSHGPSYWLRYPEDRETFAPACHAADLADCSDEQIVNAYDDTVLETDRFLSQVIDLLDASPRIVPAMFYVSDHGESLGENGLYLHGAPWAFAPEEQKRVPMVVWLSPPFRQVMALDQRCLAGKRSAAYSHDNMFSTVLGLLDVRSEVRDNALDISAGCHGVGM